MAFEEIKTALAKKPVLAYFNVKLPITLVVDASPVGLGAILLQQQHDGQQKPVAYASKALTDVERRYSQTEKEALAVVWGCEKFHLFLYGKQFTLITDHLPLKYIYSGSRTKFSPRIERWILRLQPYSFNLTHKAGKTNIADPLSRLIAPSSGSSPPTTSHEAEDYIKFTVTSAVPEAITEDEIRQATANDAELQTIMTTINNQAHWKDCPAM